MAKVTETNLTAQEMAALQKVATRLERLLRASQDFVGPAVQPPVPSSRMDIANKADLRDAYEMAGLLILTVDDHLQTVQDVIQSGRLPIFALYSLLRPAADAAVRCRHLVDAKITETQRLARGLNERFDNLREQNKVLPTAQGAALYKQRITHLEQRAAANSIAVVSDKNGKTIGFEEKVPEDLDLFTAYLPAGSTAFRFLSGNVHSKPWVQLQFDQAQPTADPNTLIAPAQLNVVLFAAVLSAILDLHDDNIGFWLSLAGYPDDVWTTAKN